MATVDELRQILKEDLGGNNLYDHLTETLMKVLIDRPSNAYANFEIISQQVKENPLNPDPIKVNEVPIPVQQSATNDNWINKWSPLFQVPSEKPAEPPVKCPDLLDEANLLEYAGISFGKAETYRLHLSIRKFAENLSGDVSALRLFGKISTLKEPYYILEGLSTDVDVFDPTKMEDKTGVNKYTYWYSIGIGAQGAWTQLPHVSMKHVVTARQFKRFLTGDPLNHVVSYPPFDGQEFHLLRAQIALIVGETSISPIDIFKKDDDGNVVMADAESLASSFPKEDLSTSEAWNHHEIELNKVGRVTAMPEVIDEATGEPKVFDEEYNPIDALAPLKPENWTFRTYPGGSAYSTRSPVIARSLIWPGAVAVTCMGNPMLTSGTRFLNIYVGNGVCATTKSYTPPLPAAIQTEWVANEDELVAFAEQVDVVNDPTPPAPEGEAEE